MKVEIQETTLYEKFKIVRGNRGINQKYLSKLIRSVKNNNLLPQNPIIVNERMEILDGQHRLKVAEMLGVSIFYTVVKTGSLTDVQMLNTNVRQWTVNDFLNSYIEIGRKDYEFLKDFSEKYNISVSNSMALLTGGFYTGWSRGKKLDEFRNGNFVVTHKDYANLFVKRLGDLRPYFDFGVEKDREFLKALEKTYKTGFSHELLLEMLKKSKGKIRKSINYREYIREIEDILSWKKNRLVRIPLRSRERKDQGKAEVAVV